MVPADAVSVVMGEFMVIVVVAFAKGEASGDDRIVAGVFLRVGLVSKGMGEGVDKEGSLVHKKHTTKAAKDQGTRKVAPAKGRNRKRQKKAKGHGNRQIVPMLEHDPLVGVKVRNIDAAGPPRVLLENHPSDMGIPKALVHAVRVLVGVDITVMGAMVTAPPARAAFERGGAPRE